MDTVKLDTQEGATVRVGDLTHSFSHASIAKMRGGKSDYHSSHEQAVEREGETRKDTYAGG